MKIAIDISQIVYEGTGVANYTSLLVKNLLKIDKVNHYLLFGIGLRKNKILSDFYHTVGKENPRVKLCLLPIPLLVADYLWNRLHVLDLEKIIGKVDIFHSSDWIQPKINSARITTVHDLVVYKFPELSHPKIIKTHKRRLYWVSQEVDLIAADSCATKEDLVKILKIEPERIEVVYPGISDDFKIVNKEEILRVKKKYYLDNNYILSVGAIEPRKNLGLLIAAFKKFQGYSFVKNIHAPIELVIIGKKGWGQTPQIQQKIKYLGFVDQQDMPGLYNGAAAFVYPSIFEGFGLPVLEAMACGVPVISSDRGSLTEIVTGASVIVDPQMSDDIAHALAQVMVDGQLRKSLIEKGKRRARNFQWENTALKILSLYEKLYKSKY